MTSSIPARVTIQISELENNIGIALAKLGLDEFESDIVAKVIMYAELRGKSQGMMKILEKTVLPAAWRSAIAVETKSTVVRLVQGNGNPGMVVLSRAVDEALETSRLHGLALIGTRGTCSSTGSIGYYANKMAQAGMIGVVLAGSPKVMAVNGSLSASMGTNPLAIAVPTLSSPLILDMATSASTWFDILLAERNGLTLPKDVAVGPDGAMTQDPVKALAGVLTTFAGAKGSGLALMIEMLTGPLMGASLVGEEEDNRGSFVLCIDPELLNLNFKADVDRALKAIRTGNRQDPSKPIRLPGDRAQSLADKQIASGTISVDSVLYKELELFANS